MTKATLKIEYAGPFALNVVTHEKFKDVKELIENNRDKISVKIDADNNQYVIALEDRVLGYISGFDYELNFCCFDNVHVQ